MFLDDFVGPMGFEEAKKLSGADKFRKTISDIETKHKPGEEHYNRLKSDPAYREQEFQKWQKEVHGDKQVEEGDLMRAAWEKSKQSMPVGHKPGWALDPKTKQELLRRQTVQQRRGVDEAELWTSDKNNWGGEDPWSTGHNEWESGTDNAWSDGNQWASEGVGPESNPADSASAIPGTPGLDTGIIEDRLHVGDPVIVTAPNAYEGKTGEIAEFSPSGRFVIVRLYNGGEHSMHLSDVEYNQYADDEDADEYGEYEDEQGVAEAGPNAPYTPSPAKPFRNPKGFNKQGTGVGNKLADLNRKEWEEKKKKEQGVTESTGDLRTELARVYRAMAPGIERHRDSHKAGELYDALEAVADARGAGKELDRMMRGARNSAHMEYDTNPGGFENWFWFLPFATDEQGVAEVKQRLDAKCWAGKHKEGTKIKGGVRVNNCVPNESVTESYWTRLQNEKNTRLNSLVNELSESVKKIK